MKCSKCNDWGFIRKRRGISRKVDIIDCDCKGEASIEQLKHDKQAILEELGDCNKAYKSLDAENAKLKEEVAELRQNVCDECSHDENYGWKFNAVEGKIPCTCITESGAYQELVAELASKNEALASRDNAIEILRQAILWDKVDPKFAFKILQDTIAKQALEKK